MTTSEPVSHVDNMDPPAEALAPSAASGGTPGPEVMAMEFVGADVGDTLHGLFNTFRLGDKWAGLSVGEPLRVVVNGEEQDGHATVRTVFHGRFDDVLLEHTALNHGVDRHAPVPERRLALQGILRECYGRSLLPTDHVTVVYMTRD